MAPIVSVIVTAHNYGRFLDQCLQSVLGQSYRNFELVIVNDGSTDNTEQVLARYVGDPRMTILTLPGVGLAAACNHGIRHSRGAFVIRLDADDFLDPHALLVETRVLLDRPDVDLVYPDFYTVDEAGNYLGCSRVPRVQDGARLLDDNPLAGVALYRRSCYDALGGYNETLRYQEDYDFWLRFTERFKAFGVGLPLLSYRQHSGSMSKNRVLRLSARRYVKRWFTGNRDLYKSVTTMVVVPGTWPGAPARSEDLLCKPLGTSTAIGFVVREAVCSGDFGSVVVVSDHDGVRQAATQAGAQACSARPSTTPKNSQIQPELLWLRDLLDTWSKEGGVMPDVVVLASPYCPLRHPERVRETVDTLLIHACDLVVGVDAEPIIPWVVGAGGLQPSHDGQSAAGVRAVRQAGELLAVSTQWLQKAGPLDDALVGRVELLHPEWWCIKDEASWQTAQALLPQASALRVPRSAYLREERGAVS